MSTSTSTLAIEKKMVPGNEVQQVELLAGVEDLYGGIIIDLEKTMDSEAFVPLLRASLSQWKHRGKRAVWIKLPIELANLVEPAVKEGFKYHHAEPDYVMLVNWISKSTNSLPKNASHRVGISAFVMNDKREVLVVQEKSGKFKGTGVWKFPTGVVDEGEDISMAAIREKKKRQNPNSNVVKETKEKPKKRRKKMSCSVAVSNSPAFSPSSSLFLNKTPIISPSTEALNLTLTHLKTSSSPASPSPSPSSPFRLRLPKPPPVSLLSSSSASNSSPSSGSGSAPGLGSGPVSTVLKRKRPARLEIPVVTEAMGLGIPATPCEVGKELEREGDGYSVYCKRGRREAMEDRFSASVELQGDSKKAIFGIFDGHGGAKAAEFAAQKLEKNILDQVITRRDNTAVMDAVKQGYLKTDAEFFKEDNAGGTCCLTALIQNGDLVVSNAGDCRAVLSRGGTAEPLTSDHRPSREDERSRIQNLGGYVDLCRGVWRIQSSLGVSRGIGDRHLKQWVIAEPETKIVSIEPDCEFLILASDGLWDKVSNQEAVDIARPSFIGTDKPNLLFACKKLVDLSVSRGSFDDISVMLVHLGYYI